MRTPLILPAAIAALSGAASTRLPVGDPDVFWHLAIGHDTLAHGLVTADAYSWTASGQPVSIDQWLGQVLWAFADAAGGWPGIVALRAVAVALLVGLIVYAAVRERTTHPLGVVLAALPAIALSRLVWTERPELFGVICFALLIVLVRAARAGSTVALYSIPPLIVLWANLHGSFALGVVLVALVALEGSIAEPSRRRGFLSVAIGSFLATLLTPATIGTWSAPAFHLLHPPRQIQEWSVPDVTTLPGAIFFVAIAATLATAFFARPDRQASREGVVLLPVLFVSLIATRQLPLFAIVAAPYLAAHGGAAIGEIASLVHLPTPRFAPVMRWPGRAADAVALALGAIMIAVAAATGVAAPALGGFPTAAVPALRSGPGLLNQYDWGGYLIANAPGTPVFVDGRLTPYLDGVLNDYSAVVGVHPGWRDVIARRGIRQILVRPTDPVAVRARDLGWPIRAASDTFVLIDVP
jgi:hypothetical protein